MTPDEAIAEQRRRWAAGDRVPVESLLARSPAAADDPDRVMDLIYNEVFLREQAGEEPTADEYTARFPALAEEVRVQFEVHAAIRGGASGPTVPGYTIARELGRGGAGTVYEAAEDATGRRVAVKLLRTELLSSADARRAFAVEARAGGVLAHPHIVQVFAVGKCPTGPYLVMELMPAGNLDDRLARGGPLSPAAAVDVLAPVAAAVHAAHAAGVFHRDLKPANILFDAAGRPKVSDFGVAKLTQGLSEGLSSTRHGIVLGTPGYMPPEQASGAAGPPTPAQDVYALGAVLFAALTGRPPHDEGSPLATILRVQAGVPPPRLQSFRPDVPDDLARVCHRCLSAKPADRYPTAAALADQLRRCGGAGGPAGPAFVVLTPAAGGGPVRVRVAPGGAVIGRSSRCDTVIDLPGISRTHCRLAVRDGVVVVTDLDSRYGTTVNGVAARGDVCLHDGDALGLATHIYGVRLEGEPTRLE